MVKFSVYLNKYVFVMIYLKMSSFGIVFCSETTGFVFPIVNTCLVNRTRGCISGGYVANSFVGEAK